MRSDYIDIKQNKNVFQTLENNSLKQIKNEGYFGVPKLYKILEMRYLGQNYGVDITLPENITNFNKNTIKKVMFFSAGFLSDGFTYFQQGKLGPLAI